MLCQLSYPPFYRRDRTRTCDPRFAEVTDDVAPAGASVHEFNSELEAVRLTKVATGTCACCRYTTGLSPLPDLNRTTPSRWEVTVTVAPDDFKLTVELGPG